MVLFLLLFVLFPAIIHSSSDMAARFVSANTRGQSLPPIQLSKIPQRIADRLTQHQLTWDSLPGLLQRAVLWDTGFILNTYQEALAVYTNCTSEGGMNDIETDKRAAQSACTVHSCGAFVDIKACEGNRTEPGVSICGLALYPRAESCNATALADITRCAVEDGPAETSEASAWAQGERNLDKLPEPVVFKHNDEIYGLHFQQEAALGECPSTLQVIIPCRRFDPTTLNV